MRNREQNNEPFPQWNHTGEKYGLECIHKIFEKQAALTPHYPAVVCEDAKITYLEFNQRANQLSRYLVENGVKPKDLIGIYAHRSIELVISILAVLKTGCVYVPLSTEYPVERINYIISDCAIKHIITQKALINELNIHHNKQKIICYDEAPIFAGKEKENPGPMDIDINDPAYVIYTSGSTGKPKGVVIPHAGICNRLMWMKDRYRFTSGDALIFKTPIGFDLSVYEILFPLLNGAKTVVVKPGGEKNLKYLTRIINEQKVTMGVFIPPLMLDMFLESIKDNDCSSLRIIICGGEKWSFSLGEKCIKKLNVCLYNGYGPTEASVGVTFWQYDLNYNKKIVPLGQPISNVKIYIVDDDLNPVPVGETGELCISGVCLAHGYLNTPELTADKFKQNPFTVERKSRYTRLYMSGDWARYLNDGYIEFFGRKDNQVKIDGVRIELGEIESILLQHPGIIEAVVLCKILENNNKLLAAFVVPLDMNSIDSDTVRNYLSSRAANVMIPGIIKIVEKLPLTANNKVDKENLAAQLE